MVVNNQISQSALTTLARSPARPNIGEGSPGAIFLARLYRLPPSFPPSLARRPPMPMPQP